MKYEFKGRFPKTKILSHWEKVGDTKMGHVDYEDFKKRMYGDAPIELERRLVKKRLAKEVGFPPSIWFPELIIECATHYDSDKRVIVVPQGKVMAQVDKGVYS
jgi:hypothetical protein